MRPTRLFLAPLSPCTGQRLRLHRGMANTDPKPTPDYSFEEAAARRGYARIAGVDEVGRGPLAGPVVAAAVWLDPARIPEGLNDSKALTAKKRESLYDEILAVADVSIASCTVEEIDEINILQASLRAMERAVAGLKQAADYVLVDGNKIPPAFGLDAEAIVKGDARSLSISAASIVAKTWRDRLMVDLAQHYPGYAWEKNAGYGTKAHLDGLRNFGVTPHHRRSFKPVHNILYQDKNVSG
ncbi:RNase HII [Celeribacter neptunius]|uniref:Ribonuclease HII n=2 Tax=Celeribacter neptunius TaxID=588602 RepID=A0A1I3S2Y0_9RHOB|nr:RNase HII [Celeribacter neptunius]